jgi:hypothetical protein
MREEKNIIGIKLDNGRETYIENCDFDFPEIPNSKKSFDFTSDVTKAMKFTEEEAKIVAKYLEENPPLLVSIKRPD